MAKNSTLFFTKDGKVSAVNITSVGGATLIYTAGAEGAKILAIGLGKVSGTSTSIELSINKGAGDLSIGKLSYTPAAGDDLLTLLMPFLPLDKNGNKFFNIEAGDIIKATLTGTATNADVVLYAEEY